jgi:hypothetical protein
MEEYFNKCSGWSAYELEQLKLYIETRINIKALTPEEVESS